MLFLFFLSKKLCKKWLSLCYLVLVEGKSEIPGKFGNTIVAVGINVKFSS